MPVISGPNCTWLLLFWLCLLYLTGIWLFSEGFLLRRTELPLNSTCADFATEVSEHGRGSCWLRPRFRKVVWVIVDALRVDFAFEAPVDRPARSYEGRLGVLRRALAEEPQRARIFHAHADPPTTTMQRLKALTTGGLPTFVDAGSSFSSARIAEDNLILQLHGNGACLGWASVMCPRGENVMLISWHRFENLPEILIPWKRNLHFA